MRVCECARACLPAHVTACQSVVFVYACIQIYSVSGTNIKSMGQVKKISLSEWSCRLIVLRLLLLAPGAGTFSRNFTINLP